MGIKELQTRIKRLQAQNSKLRKKLFDAEEIIGIMRGLNSIERGEFITLAEFDQKMRAKYNIPRRAKK